MGQAPSTGDASHVDFRDPVPSDIEVSQSVVPERISEIASRYDILPNELEPYGSYKAKVSPALLARKRDDATGLYVVVTGITPTPLGEGKSTTTIGLTQAIGSVLNKPVFACIRQPSQGPTFGVKGGAAGGGYAQVVPMEEFNLHLTGDIHAITAANNLVAAALDTRMFHEATQSDEALFNRLCPCDVKSGIRSLAPALRSRLKAQGVQGWESIAAEDLTESQVSQLVRLNIDADTITWKRVVDTCDRHLREIQIGLSPTETKGDTFIGRHTGFDITVASEIMAILALAESAKDMRSRFGRMVVASDVDGVPVTCEDLCVAGAVSVLMREAIKPTLMQTIERTPVFVHAGPFANIAHGNSSVIADKMALKLVGENGVCVTEAGFGADIGAEKFFDIKCRSSGLTPHVAVIVATVRALKSHGGAPPVKAGKPLAAEYTTENVEVLRKGVCNLLKHVENLKKFGVGVVVAINQFHTDTQAELDVLLDLASARADAAVVSNHWALGGAGAADLATAVYETAQRVRSAKSSAFKFLYELKLPLKSKIEAICVGIYGASMVSYSDLAETQLARYESLMGSELSVCIAKTQYSFSADPMLKGAPTGFTVTVREALCSAGAGFVFVKLGAIMTIPGLPTRPGFVDVDLDFSEDPLGRVVGLF